MIIAVKEVLNLAPETDMYLLDLSKVKEPVRSLVMGEINRDDGHIAGMEVNQDQWNSSIEDATVDPPAMVEVLFEVWLD